MMLDNLKYNLSKRGGRREFDAVVVGSGPNGLSAAITLQKRGLSVLLIEGESCIGGGIRSGELTLPGFIHDICSAVYPFAHSLFFKSLNLSDFGLELIKSPVALAHPLEGGRAVSVGPSLSRTAQSLEADSASYLNLITPLLKDWGKIAGDILGPLRFPAHPLASGRFAWYGFSSVGHLVRRFKGPAAKALMAGLGAHGMQPLSNKATSAFALTLLLAGHARGWPFPKGGAGRLANALGACFKSLGGKVILNATIHSLEDLPSSAIVLLDMTPAQLIKIGSAAFSSFYRWQMKKYRYGMGVFKVDYALKEPIPFLAPECREAATVHLGNSFEEIARSERDTWHGNCSGLPFVILVQPSLFDPTRAPADKHTAWAYCHVPPYYTIDMQGPVEAQIERFAPGFKDCIVARHVMSPAYLESYNPNYIGGDIHGGVQDLSQLFTRPALRFSPYRTSAKGIYICSSSTPPGPGVHGLCGYYAAKRALKDIFHISL